MWGRVGDKGGEGVVVALYVLDIGIRAPPMGYEQPSDVGVGVAIVTRRPLHGSGDEIATEGIDSSALFEEVATCKYSMIL
jgi:hypothetical protein